MRYAGRRRGCVSMAMVVFCACSSAAQPAPEIRGVVHMFGGSAVKQAEVRIEGEDSSVLTTDSGNFKLKMSANLHVGMPAVFHVTDWVILQPCELRNGRAKCGPNYLTLRHNKAARVKALVKWCRQLRCWGGRNNHVRTRMDVGRPQDAWPLSPCAEKNLARACLGPSRNSSTMATRCTQGIVQ